MIFPKHSVAAVGTANFMNAKTDERLMPILKFLATFVSLAGCVPNAPGPEHETGVTVFTLLPPRWARLRQVSV
jgi:hypothetical protein